MASNNKRMKKAVVTGVTREMADRAFAEYAKALSRQKKIAADVELACTRIREKYQDELSALSEEAEKAFEVLRVYADEHPEAFGGRRSLEMAHGRVGYRTGMPQLRTERGFTQAAVIALIKDAFPERAAEFVTVKESLNKEAIIASVRQPAEAEGWLDGARLERECHATVVQEETFYVEARTED